MYKTCSSCKQSKLTTYFNKQSKTKDGLHNYCRECSKAKFKAWVPPKKITVPCGYKHCKTCDAILPHGEFIVNKDGADGFYSVCRHCCAERSATQRSCPEYRHRVKLLNQAYTRRNKDKANVKSAARRAARVRATVDFGDKEFEDLYLQEIYNLAIIREAATGVKWEVDHMAPLISEFVCGLHWSANLQLLTAFDNRSKSNNYWPDMWQEEETNDYRPNYESRKGSPPNC